MKQCEILNNESAFMEWLDENIDSRVGRSHSGEYCPLAQYLKVNGVEFPTVNDEDYSVDTYHPGKLDYLPLPEWAMYVREIADSKEEDYIWNGKELSDAISNSKMEREIGKLVYLLPKGSGL